MIPTNGPIEGMLGHFFTLLMLLFSVDAFATLTYTQSSGASAVDLTTPTAPIIYGGFAGTCPVGETTCNSCTGTIVSGTGLVPCNPNNIIPSTTLSLTIATSSALIAAPEAHITNSTGVSVGTVSWAVGAQSFTINILWSDLCNNAPTNNDSNCLKDISMDLYIQAATSSGGSSTTDNITLKIITRYVDTTTSTTWNYLDCPTTDPNTTNVGFCHFSVLPGDKKIYANELAVSSAFPSSENSSAPYNNLIFFYEVQTSADGSSDAATRARITNASPMYKFGVNTTASPPVADNRIDGLTDGNRYCLIMASQDVTGVINHFTPSTVNVNTLCTTPEPVVGLLDDKHCFIATAAFGSDMAPEVQVLRSFRNKYLLPFSWGQKIVSTYYRYSPQYAQMISENEISKSVVRAVLWPVLIFAKVSLSFGVPMTLLILFAICLFCFGCVQLWMKRKKLSGVL